MTARSARTAKPKGQPRTQRVPSVQEKLLVKLFMEHGHSQEFAEFKVALYQRANHLMTEFVAAMLDVPDTEPAMIVEMSEALMSALVVNMHQAHFQAPEQWHRALEAGALVFRSLTPDFHGFQCGAIPEVGGEQQVFLKICDTHGIERVSISTDGKVAMAPSVAKDQAARMFWLEIQRQAYEYILANAQTKKPEPSGPSTN